MSNLEPNLEELLASFSQISSGDQAVAFCERHGIKIDRSRSAPTSTTYWRAVGMVGDLAVRMRHWWYDPSGPFQNEPDVERVEIVVAGETHRVEWVDR